MSDHHERLRRNDESRARAKKHRELWSQDEIDVLMLWDRSDSELTAVAEMLERTREACRERYYLIRRGAIQFSERTMTTTTTTTVEYRGWKEGDGDGWD